MKKASLILLVFMLFALLVFTGCEETAGEEEATDEAVDGPLTVRFASASLGSSGYVIITALAATAQENIDEYNCASISTSGAAENIGLLYNGDVDFGQLVSTSTVLAMRGEEPFEEEMEVWQCMGYIEWAIGLVVPEASGIEHPSELEGGILAVGPAGGIGAIIVKDFVEVLIPGGVNYEYGSWSDCHDMVVTGRADGVVMAAEGGEIGNPALMEHEATQDIIILQMSKDEAEEIAERAPGCGVSYFQPGLVNVTEPETHYNIAYRGLLGVNPDTPEEVVYNVVKALVENQERVREAGAALRFFTDDYFVSYMSHEIPVHPGAARYWKEVGLWDDNLIIGEQ